MKTCPECHKQFSDDVKFCTNCGAALPLYADVVRVFVPASSKPFAKKARQFDKSEMCAKIACFVIGLFVDVVAIISFTLTSTDLAQNKNPNTGTQTEYVSAAQTYSPAVKPVSPLPRPQPA